jgi:hypothetical protein
LSHRENLVFARGVSFPIAGVQPGVASGLGIGAIEVDTAPLVAYVGNPRDSPIIPRLADQDP